MHLRGAAAERDNAPFAGNESRQARFSGEVTVAKGSLEGAGG